MNGQKNAETSSMDFYAQLPLKAGRNYLKIYGLIFEKKRRIWYGKAKRKIHHISKIAYGIFDSLVLGFMVS